MGDAATPQAPIRRYAPHVLWGNRDDFIARLFMVQRVVPWLKPDTKKVDYDCDSTGAARNADAG